MSRCTLPAAGVPWDDPGAEGEGFTTARDSPAELLVNAKCRDERDSEDFDEVPSTSCNKTSTDLHRAGIAGTFMPPTPPLMPDDPPEALVTVNGVVPDCDVED